MRRHCLILIRLTNKIIYGGILLLLNLRNFRVLSVIGPFKFTYWTYRVRDVPGINMDDHMVCAEAGWVRNRGRAVQLSLCLGL